VAFRIWRKAPKETAVNITKDILLVVDYHAENLEVRIFNGATGEERRENCKTTRANIQRLVEQARAEAAPAGGMVRWIMESTTGWARVKELIGGQAEFVLANVLQMPLPPKWRRRQSDKIDTARMLRETLNGSLPRSFQPSGWWRQVRRVVDSREHLVRRQTAIKNWITSLLAHETWQDRTALFSAKGLRRLAQMDWPATDRVVLDLKLEQLRQLAPQIERIEQEMKKLWDAWPEAQWADEARGIGMVTAVSVLAHIGPVERFASAEELISYAGLAPGCSFSDGKGYNGRIGGGGTDSHLRYLLIEATTWLCQIPRYRPAYERTVRKRGKKIARIVVARMFLRSLYKMLREKIRFNQAPAA
jgi:transposase